MSQSNTRVGDFRVLAGEDLSGTAGLLVRLGDDGGKAVARLPAAVSDYALFVVIEGAAAGEMMAVRPLEAGRNVRVRLKGSCAPGDVLVLADPTSAADKGKLRALPEAADTYRGLAIAEEQGVDGQLVLCRPAMIGDVVVE